MIVITRNYSGARSQNENETLRQDLCESLRGLAPKIEEPTPFCFIP